jgi:hypothetical protein
VIYSTEVKSKFSEIEMKKKFSSKIFGDRKLGTYMNPLKKSSNNLLKQSNENQNKDLTNNKNSKNKINNTNIDNLSKEQKIFDNKNENNKENTEKLNTTNSMNTPKKSKRIVLKQNTTFSGLDKNVAKKLTSK